MKLYRLFIVLFVCLLGTSAAVSAQTESAAESPDVDPNAIQITLQRAIEMALENNLDIVVSRLDTQVRAEGVQFARGVYQPFISLGINTLDSSSPAQNQLVGAQTLTSTRTNYNFTWEQQLATGGNYNIQWFNLRSTTNSAFAGFNPLYNSVASAQITQPLMANFGTDASKRQILVARNGERISRNQFEVQVMDTVRDVEFAYWDLVFAIRDLDVARRSLGLAEDLLRNNRIQVEVGTMAPIDVLEAQAEVAVRDETVILAEELIRVTEDILKRLINDPEAPDFWANSYAPIDQPTIEEIDVDVDDAVRVALSRRPILQQSRVELETRTYNVRFSRNQLMPQLDVVGSLAFTGIGGTQLIREGFAGEPSQIIPGGYGDAIDQVFGRDFRDWSIGSTFLIRSVTRRPKRSTRRTKWRRGSNELSSTRTRFSSRRKFGARREPSPPIASVSTRPASHESSRNADSKRNRRSSRSVCRRAFSSCKRSAICRRRPRMI